MPEKTLTIPPPIQRDQVVIRFAGDSGDGIQLAGSQFTAASAAFGNDLVTFPDYPAEIRAPAGTLLGVSSFQVHIADWEILTPGDRPDVLVVMNPAALKVNIGDLQPGGLLLINRDSFDERNLAKAEYDANPLEDGSLRGYHVLTAPMEELTKAAVKGTGVPGRAALRSKNFFALGLISWMFNRPTEPIFDWIEEKYGDDPVGKGNAAAFRAGYNFGITTQEYHHTYEIHPAHLTPGVYTNINGNQALAWGLIAGCEAVGRPLFLSSYPITPATSILEALARHRHFGIRTIQAEDEIAAACMALGASFAGHVGVTTTSGPGMALKSETISLAVMTELPLVIVDVQRAGPSTGLPTKVEQGDLGMALYGRHGDAPLPVIAAASPGDAFNAAIEAVRVAVKYMTPVILLSDGYVANSSEPWLIPDFDEIAESPAVFATEPNGPEGEFFPYARNPKTLARPWALPGTPGLEHRIGGLEKQDLTGSVSYDPENHQRMLALREAKVARVADDITPVKITGDPDSELLIVSWGSTFGAVRAGRNNAEKAGHPAAHVHLRWLKPLPRDLGEVLDRYNTILVPELNRGQLARLLRSEYLVPTISLDKTKGIPFTAAEISDKIVELLEDET